MKPIRKLLPPGPVYSEDYNALAAEVARLSKLIGDGIDVDHGPGNVTLTVPRPRDRFVVKVYADEDSPADGCTTQAYRWVRQVPAACGVQGDEAPTPVTGSVSTNNPAYEPNGATIADGTVVEIIPGAAYLDSGGNVVQEWIILRGGGTAAGVEVVRIESWFVKDHAGATGCSGGPSPACFYPGVPQKWDCVNRYTDDAGKEKVWVDLTFSDQAPVQGVGGAPATTVVTATGNTRILAKSLGKRYRPDEGVKVPPNPFNDQERPVYGSDSIACLIIMNCGTPPGGIQSGEGG
jgi:hypothetical protein